MLDCLMIMFRNDINRTTMSTMMSTLIIFSIYSVAFMTDVCLAQADATSQFCEQNAEISTDKVIYRKEETLTASCILPSSCYRHLDNVILRLADDALPITDTIIGNTTFTVLARYTVQAEDNGKHLSCIINSHGTIPESLTAQKKLIVAEPPSPVDEITCVVFSYQSMNCSFWPEQQNTGLPTSYRIYYQRQFFQPGKPENFERCPNRKGNTCIFSGRNFYRLGYYTIYVQARNELGVANKTSVFDVERQVKLDRISTLKVSNKGTTWIKLSWQKPYPEHILENTTYEITLHSSSDSRAAVIKNITSQSTDVAFNVTDLIPYIRYTVTIRSFPWYSLGAEVHPGGYWSDPVSVKVTTLADVPGAAPNVTAGGFFYHRETGMLDLYWQRVPLLLIHGKPDHYRVRLFERSADQVPSCDGSNPVVWRVGTDSSSTNKTILRRGSYDVCIDLSNDIGYNESLLLTPVRVSENVSDLPLPRFYMRLSEDDQVEVRILEDTGATRYTLFWCESFIISCLNKEIHWMYVNSSELTSRIVTDLPVRHLIVALSAEYSRGKGYIVSSGMKYTAHLFKKASSAIQMPVDVKAINSKAGSITVQWKKPNKVDTVYIDHFTVDYCLKEDCTDQTKHQQVAFEIQGDLDGTQQIVSVSDLAEEKVYEVRVRSDGDGKNSNYTDPIEVVVPKSGLSKSWTIAIVVLCALAVVPVAGILYGVIRKCRKTVVEYNRPLHVIIPTVDEQLQEQNDHTAQSDGQYSDIHQDDYERIQEGQNDKRGNERPGTVQLPSEALAGETNAAAQSEEVTLLSKHPNGHIIALYEINTGDHGSGIS